MDHQALSPETIQPDDNISTISTAATTATTNTKNPTAQDARPPPPPPTTTTTATAVPADQIDSTFAKTTNLTSATLGAKILDFSDEWFASASNLLTPTPPIRRPGVYVHTGAWYDGWETRRHNPEAFDWVVIRLGVARGKVSGVEIDTAFFDGNHAPLASLEGVDMSGEGEGEGAKKEKEDHTRWKWEYILEPSECGPSRRQAWKIHHHHHHHPDGHTYTHVRLGMWPDGGIARLRLYGHAVPPPFVVNDDHDHDHDHDPGSRSGSAVQELSAATNGGLAVSCSDQHFGVMANLLLPGRGVDMGDGWETKRHRGPGHTDWVVVRLGMVGTVERLVVDTKDFRGNFPRACRVEGWVKKRDLRGDKDKEEEQGEQEGGGEEKGEGEGEGDPEAEAEGWMELLDERKCKADTEHDFDVRDVAGQRVFSHVKLVIVPDGGVKRFRVLGRRTG